jgi:S-adenosylmethionine:tRNA ribosyltransferase-isomerase
LDAWKVRTAEFDFELPPELIAQTPAARRDESRLLVLNRNSRQVAHRKFIDLLEFMRAGDVLVLNNSRVIPARLGGRSAKTGGEFEVLLVEENATNDWWVMMRPGKRARVGTRIAFRDLQGKDAGLEAVVIGVNEEGHRRLRFETERGGGEAGKGEDVKDWLDEFGEVPLPPYIERVGTSGTEADRERYQTVYADPAGSVAAPTAGLHFTEAFLEEIRGSGIQVCFVTLHVGLGTFAPVKSETIEGHVMHEERYELSEETAQAVNAAKREGRRVVAVGTTSVRVLESAARAGELTGAQHQSLLTSAPTVLGSAPTISGKAPAITGSGPLIKAGQGKTRIFIYPPYEFRIVDVLLTNFHLPHSTLLMLVSAFAAPKEAKGREMVLCAYAEAVREKYRFFSYGDAMLLI